MKYVFAFIAAMVLVASPAAALPPVGGFAMSPPAAAATFDERFVFAQAQTETTTQTNTPTQPASVTTVVKGGSIAADVLQWVQVALVPILGAAFVGLILKGMALLGIQTTAQQSDQLAKIALNGINDAFSKGQSSLRGTSALDITLKGQFMADAVAYTQVHAKETLKAMGLDPTSGKATEAIRAKIETALNDPTKATPDAITPLSGKPVSAATITPTINGVAIEGARV